MALQNKNHYVRLFPLVLSLSGCGPEIEDSSGLGYNSTPTYSPTRFVPTCDAGCPDPTPPPQAPAPQPPVPQPPVNPVDASLEDIVDVVIVDAVIPVDASWAGLCVAYGYPGQDGPVCRRRGRNNEIDEGGILGCDHSGPNGAAGAPCCSNPDIQYTPIDPEPCTAGNWAPGYPQSIPAEHSGKCVQIGAGETEACQAYLVDVSISPVQIQTAPGGVRSCDDLGNPCCYVSVTPPLENREPNCQAPSDVTWISDRDF